MRMNLLSAWSNHLLRSPRLKAGQPQHAGRCGWLPRPEPDVCKVRTERIGGQSFPNPPKVDTV
jgi:hypothetical protein